MFISQTMQTREETFGHSFRKVTTNILKAVNDNIPVYVTFLCPIITFLCVTPDWVHLVLRAILACRLLCAVESRQSAILYE